MAPSKSRPVQCDSATREVSDLIKEQLLKKENQADSEKRAENHLADPNRTSGRESGSEDSDAIQELTAAHPSPKRSTAKTLKMVCQAHQLHMGRLGGVAIFPKPCQGKRIRDEAVLRSDWSIQSGIRIVDPPGPPFVDLRNKRRGEYNIRKGEFKCQKGGCYHTGILMEFG